MTDSAEIDATESALERARALHAMSRYAEAAIVLRGALAHDPNDPDLWCRLSAALVSSGRASEALEASEQGIAADPEWSVGHRLRGQALRDLGHFQEALDSMREAVEVDPFDVRALAKLAWFAGEKGFYEEALEAGRAAVEVDPADPVAWFGQGWAALMSGDFDLAEQSLRESVSLAPDDPYALNNLGVCLRKLGRRDEAIDLFRRASAVDPESEYALKNLARGLLVRGDAEGLETWRLAWEADLHYWESKLAADPSNVLAHRLRARALEYLGRDDEALESARTATQIAGETASAASSWATLASIAFDLGRSDEAREAIARAVELDPDSDVVLYDWAWSAWLLDDPAQARSAEDRARALMATSNPDLWAVAGFAALARGEAAEAQRNLDRALERETISEDCCLREAAGVASALVGNFDAAKRFSREASARRGGRRCATALKLAEILGETQGVSDQD